MDVAVLGCLMFSIGLVGAWLWVWIRWAICLLCCLFWVSDFVGWIEFGYCELFGVWVIIALFYVIVGLFVRVIGGLC